jgi:hypothetical protein
VKKQKAYKNFSIFSPIKHLHHHVHNNRTSHG